MSAGRETQEPLLRRGICPHREARLLNRARSIACDPEVEHMTGSAETQILSHASEWGADLIVMGNSRRSFILRQLFGETLLHVMQKADLPLFLSE